MRILCVHQGYELYGSDRMFLLSLKAFREKYPESHITVHLPKEGSLSELIFKDKVVDELIIREMGVLRKNDFKKFRFKQIFSQLANIPDKVKFCDKFDIVYVNSIVVVDYLIACHYTTAKSIVHIHEIPSKLLTGIFQRLIKFSQSYSIFISNAVRQNFPKIRNGEIVLNGIQGFAYCNRHCKEILNILHIGRINAWKGQDFLLRSIAGLDSKSKKRINVHIVGGVFEDQIHFKTQLETMVTEYSLNSIVSFHDFRENPEEDYRWADVVVVPSKLPEPFGLVAIEAMSTGAIVLAAKHGGLSEVFEDGTSGIYFEPNNEEALKEALTGILNSSEKVKLLSRNGHKIYKEKFTEEAYISRFAAAIGNIEE